MSGKPDDILMGNHVMEWHPIQGRVVAFMLRKLVEAHTGETLGLSTATLNTSERKLSYSIFKQIDIKDS